MAIWVVVAAYFAALAQLPHNRVILRQGTRVVRDSVQMN
jgi:hypothetical protein